MGQGSTAASAAFDLARFLEAQAPVYERVRNELEAGRKDSHWMWFIFPQLRGLGQSAMARRYGLSGLAEAQAYLRHAVLGARLIECTELVNGAAVASIRHVFGSPDDLKFCSCITLFAALPAAPSVFTQALERYYDGRADPLTIGALACERSKGAG